MKDHNRLLSQQIWQKVEEDIELKIIRDHYTSFNKLPSILELSSIYDVSKTTIQKALDSLCANGILTKRHGIGFFVYPYTKENLKKKYFESSKIKIFEIAEYINKLNVDEEQLDLLLTELKDYLIVNTTSIIE